MKNYNLLFSFSFAAFSVAALGGGVLFLESNKGKIQSEPVPTLLPHPAPVDAAPPTLDLPVNTITLAPVVITTPKVSKLHTSALKAKIAQAPKEREMVCNGGWQDSNYGGQYRVCEMK